MDYDTVTVQILSAEPSPDAPNVVVDGDTFGTFSVAAATAPADATPQAQGQQIYKALFVGDVATALEQAWGRATGDEHGLRLRIQSNVAAVMALPWEYLYDDQRGFWAQNPATPIVRYLPFPQNIAPLNVTLPLRVLTVLASPSDAPTLNVEAEWTALTDALTPLQEQGLVELVRLTPPTLEQLRETLIASPFQVLHFVGHGAWADDEGGLLFAQADGTGDLVKGSRLAATLKGYSALRLAVLNACEGAAVAETGSVFNGVAQRLAQQSALTVVAMQFPIADRHARGFAEQWYRAVAAGWSVDAALAEGRKALLDDSSAWAAPVLYMRTRSGVLFDVPAPDPQKRIAFLAGQADMMLRQRNWAQAIRPLERILEIDPIHADTLIQLASAKAHIEVETTLYAQLLDLMEAQQWQEAFLLIERIDKQYPSYKDVAQRRALVAASLKPVNPEPLAAKGEHDDVYDAVVTALQYGELVPFLGGNAVLSGRMPGATWDKDAYLPSYAELATHLATALNYRRGGAESAPSLAHVAQYGSMMNRLKLYGELDRIFSGNYTPTPLHRLLAEIPSRLAAVGYPVTSTPLAHHFIIVSVAYDTLMERAFDAQGQPYHLLVVTLPDTIGQSGNLIHTPPGGAPLVIQDGNSYDGFTSDTHPVLLKLVGDKPTRKGNVVITEDQFIDYDALHRLRLLLPSAIKTALQESSFLFLGYALQEWQLRLVLHRLGTVNRASDQASWTLATQLEPWEAKIWDTYNIAPVPVDVDGFVEGLRGWLERMPPA